MHASVREDHFVEQDGGIRTHGCDDVSEDLAAFVVGPVVENGAEIVELCACALFRGVLIDVKWGVYFGGDEKGRVEGSGMYL